MDSNRIKKLITCFKLINKNTPEDKELLLTAKKFKELSEEKRKN